MAIQKIGVVGFGAMGSGIAQACAQAGFDVVVREVDHGAIERGFASMDGSLARLVKGGRASEGDAKAARQRIRPTISLEDLRDCDIVIEAVLEIMGTKREVFAELDRCCKAETIFTSNTSSLPITDMAAVTKRADRFAGLHFFNPVAVMQLVEVVRGVTTSDETMSTLRAFVEKLGKTPVICKDTPGFVVNKLLVPYMIGAIRLLEQDVASPEDIDAAVKLGLRHPMGPFELLDYTGLDIAMHVADVLYDEFKDPSMAPPPLLRRLVAAGHLGKKSGRGFYEYDEKGERKKP
ncbi:MAG: 3-hydroxyacyl-CoA dehydrogenase family protein [Candidatus Limnocylindria bacterium]